MTFNIHVERQAASLEQEVTVSHREPDGRYSMARLRVREDDERALGQAIGALIMFIAKRGGIPGSLLCLRGPAVAYNMAARADFGRD